MEQQLRDIDALLKRLVQERREKIQKLEDDELEDVDSQDRNGAVGDATSSGRSVAGNLPEQDHSDHKSGLASGEDLHAVDQENDNNEEVYRGNESDDEDLPRLRMDAPVLWQASDRLELAVKIPHDLLTEAQVIEQEEMHAEMENQRHVRIDEDDLKGGAPSPYGTAWYLPPEKWGQAALGTSPKPPAASPRRFENGLSL